jgi:hypothetical protein
MLLNPKWGSFPKPTLSSKSLLALKVLLPCLCSSSLFLLWVPFLAYFPFLIQFVFVFLFFLGFLGRPLLFWTFYIINLIIGSSLNPYEVILSSLASECALHQLGFLIGELLFQSSLSLSPVLQMCPVQTFTNE